MGRFLAVLAERGLSAQLVGGKLKLSPGNKVTPKLAEHIRAHLPAIIAELRPPTDIPLIAAVRKKREVYPLIPSPWADQPGQPSHDLDRLTDTLKCIFARCEALGWKAQQYWEPPAPKPTQRPYCYVKSILVDGSWLYMPMLADIDGTDYLWAVINEKPPARMSRA